MESIWTPKVVFTNTEKRDGLKKDAKAHATVANYGKFVTATDDIIDNTQIFQGTENPITLSRAYKGKYMLLRGSIYLMLGFFSSGFYMQF